MDCFKAPTWQNWIAVLGFILFCAALGLVAYLEFAC
jgi:hypothetical protein